MATNAIVKKESELVVQPGFHSYINPNKIYLPPSLKQIDKLSSAANSFKSILEQATKQKPSPQKQVAISNWLPVTSALAQRVGPQGIMLVSSYLKLLQYYKKSSPMPRYV